MKLILTPPTPKQKEFLLARSRYIAYGGSRGGGKSHAVRMKAALLSLHYNGIKILILRRTYPELYENHIKIMAAELDGAAVYRDADKSLTFPNGSRIKFGYCANDADVTQYQGQEYDVIFIDEATQFTEYQFITIRTCMRGVNDFPRRMYLTCNPGGIGHGWVKRLFVDRIYGAGEQAEDYTFIKASVYDNKPLLANDPGYLYSLRNLPDDLRRAWLNGDWNLFAGQYFSEFSNDIHVCEPFTIPSWWRVYRAFDYGLDMLACLWIALDERDNAYVIRELCEPNLIVSEAAARIIEYSGTESVCSTLAPPDLWNRQKDTGKSIWELFEGSGIRLTHADNNRSQGWLNLKEWLKPSLLPDGSGQSAKLQIFSTCTELIRCLPALLHDTKNPSDCAREPHEITHICDALRYFIRSRPRSSKEPSVRNTSWEQEARARTIRECARGAKRRRGY